MKRHAGVVLGALTVALALVGCGGETGGPAPSPEPAPVASPGVVASGLEAPWSVAFAGEVPLVSERDSGRILALGEGTATELMTVEDSRGPGEGGLLGLAVANHHLYAYFTAGDENRIVRYPLTGDGDDGRDLTAGDPETVLDGIPAGTVHNGGRIAFGPDGMLYATVGDAADTGHSQDLDSLAGKILRMTPEGGVPDDNPFPGSYVFSYGHRNPQGIAWDESGTMYASEFGQNTWDELNVIEPGGNYGWPAVEGIAGEQGYIDPVQQWEPGEASPSGIAVHAGSIWIANLRGESLREVPLADLTASTRHYVGEYGRIRDAVLSPDGHLWMVTNNPDGRGDPGPGDDRILAITGL